MTNDISSSSETPAPTLTPGSVPRAARWRRLGLPWLLVAALVVAAAIVVPDVIIEPNEPAPAIAVAPPVPPRIDVEPPAPPPLSRSPASSTQ